MVEEGFDDGEGDGAGGVGGGVGAVGEVFVELGGVVVFEFLPGGPVVDEGEVVIGGIFSPGVVVGGVVGAVVGGGFAWLLGSVPDGVHDLNDDVGVGVLLADGGDHGVEVGDGFFERDVEEGDGVVDGEFEEDEIGVVIEDAGLEVFEAEVGGDAGDGRVKDGDLVGEVFVEPGLEAFGPRGDGGEGGAVGDDGLFFAGGEVGEEVEGRGGLSGGGGGGGEKSEEEGDGEETAEEGAGHLKSPVRER